MRSSRHTRPQRRRTSQSRCPGLAACHRCGRKLAVRSPCRSLFSSSVAVTTAGIALRFMPAGSACGLVCNPRQPCLRRFGLRLTCRSTGQRPAGKVSALRIVHLRRALPVTSNVGPPAVHSAARNRSVLGLGIVRIGRASRHSIVVAQDVSVLGGRSACRRKRQWRSGEVALQGLRLWVGPVAQAGNAAAVTLRRALLLAVASLPAGLGPTLRSSGRATAGWLAREAVVVHHRSRGQASQPRRAA